MRQTTEGDPGKLHYPVLQMVICFLVGCDGKQKDGVSGVDGQVAVPERALCVGIDHFHVWEFLVISNNLIFGPSENVLYERSVHV